MNDQIVKMVAQKAGVDAALVEKVLDTLQGFLKENPDKLTAFLGEESPIGEVGGKLGKLFGR